MKRAIGLLITIAFANSVFAAAEIGKPAPDFTATDINGKTHKLSDYKGKIVVLEEYNLDCPFCHNHFKTGAMQEVQGEITGKGVIWLLVNSAGRNSPSYRTPEAAKKEWATQKIKATAWIDDSSGELGRKYGMRTPPHMFVIDKEGALQYMGGIDSIATADAGDIPHAEPYLKEAMLAVAQGTPVAHAVTTPYGCSVKY